MMTTTPSELVERLREWADVHEKSVSFLDDDLAAEAEAETAILRDAAELIERLTGGEFPTLTGEDVSDKLILRQHAGEGKLGPATIALSSTAGLGGFALIVGIERPDVSTVYVAYDLMPHVEQIAQAVLDRATTSPTQEGVQQ